MIATPHNIPAACCLDGLRQLLAKLSGCRVESQSHRIGDRFWHHEPPRREIPTRVVTIDVEDVLAFHEQDVGFTADGGEFLARHIGTHTVDGRQVATFEVESAP